MSVWPPSNLAYGVNDNLRVCNNGLFIIAIILIITIPEIAGTRRRHYIIISIDNKYSTNTTKN